MLREKDIPAEEIAPSIPGHDAAEEERLSRLAQERMVDAVQYMRSDEEVAENLKEGKGTLGQEHRPTLSEEERSKMSPKEIYNWEAANDPVRVEDEMLEFREEIKDLDRDKLFDSKRVQIRMMMENLDEDAFLRKYKPDLLPTDR